MKKMAIITIGSLAVAFALVALIGLNLSKPRRVGIVPGSVVIQDIPLPNKGRGIYLKGDLMNHLGQIQGTSIRFDPSTNKFFIDRYVIYWHPFSKLKATNDWPMLIDVSNLSPGKYEIWYWVSANRYELASDIKIP